jgi:hypothetical protein
LVEKYLLFMTVFIVVLSLYVTSLAPGVVGGDAGEHQLAVPLLGIPHATGYPLYVLLGKLWTMIIPIGDMAWRMNLLSAVGGALAASMTSIVVYQLRESTGSHLAGAFTAGITLALGLTLWQWSIIAGVRSINVLFFALLTFEAIIWQQQSVKQSEDCATRKAAEKTLCWLALTVGLSLTHHRTTIFYLPSLIIWIWWHDRQLIWQPARWLKLVCLATIPLFLYGFIYFRGINDPPYTHEKITDLQSFWFLVGASDSSGLFMHIDPAFLLARLQFIWNDILRQLSWPGVIAAMFGAVFLAREQTKHFLFQGLLVLLLLLFVIDFEVVNLNEAPTWYLMPAYFIFAVWVGIGINGVSDILLNLSPLRGFRGATLLFNLLFLFTLYQFLYLPNWQQIYNESTQPLDDWRQLLRGTQARRFVESSLSHVEPDSLILGDWEQFTPMVYYKLINGQRSDITPRIPLDRWPEQVTAAHARGQPVYFMRKTPDLVGTPYLSMVGALIHLRSTPLTEPPANIILLQANLEDELELVGYRLELLPQDTPGGAQAGPIIQLMLYWRASHKLAWDYALSLRLIDTTDQEIYKKDAAHPVLSSYPTSLWTPGEVVADFYELPHPPDIGPLTLWIVVYRADESGWHNLRLSNTDSPQEGIKLLVGN